MSLIHAAAIGLLATQIQFHHLTPMGSELEFTIYSPHQPLLARTRPSSDWSFKLPDTVVVLQPDIQIAPSLGTGNDLGDHQITERLAPTLDPTHVNEQPQLPGTLGNLIAALALRLNVLVLTDGTVLNVRVVKSTGESEIDKLAIEWVRNNWHFLPAIRNGRPVAAWTTIMVRFAPIH